MKLTVKCVALFAVCLSAASKVNGQSADVAIEQAHIQTLADQSNQTADALGEKIDQVSGGGMNFLAFGAKAPELLNALSNLSALSALRAPVSDPGEPEDFISRLAGHTQSEESVAWCGTNALVGFNDSGSFVKTFAKPGTDSPSGSFSFNGWASSTNAGTSFVDKGILVADPLPAGIKFRDLAGDPVLGCTSSSTFYYASLATDTMTDNTVFSGISVSQSTDGGATFQGAVMAVAKPATTHSLDKPSMSVNQVDGVDIIHVTYTDFFIGDPCPANVPGTSIEYVRSIDGGGTWSAPTPISAVICGVVPLVQGSSVAVGLADDVYVAWESFPAGPGRGPSTILLRKSVDAGVSFSPATTVAGVTPVGDGRRVQGLFRTFIDLQGVAVDRTSGLATSGNLYITWHDGRNKSQIDPFASPGCLGAGRYCFGDIFVSRSITGGNTWSPAIQVNNDPLTLGDHLFPALAVDNAGQVHVVFYDRRRDKRNFLIDTFVSTSGNGGASWTNARVTRRSFPAIIAQDLVVNPTYMGDYLGIAADKLNIYPGVIVAWGDNSRGDPNVLAAYRVP
jgi:hypothetical protein